MMTATATAAVSAIDDEAILLALVDEGLAGKFDCICNRITGWKVLYSMSNQPGWS
jgi:hypothetical protein